MKVWEDSDLLSLISHYEVSEIRSIQMILHFRLFYCDKNSLSCRCFVQSYVFPLLKRFSWGTFSKSQEITVVIAGLRFRLMAHSELLDSPSNNVRSCFATCSTMLDYQCSITRLRMFDSLAKALLTNVETVRAVHILFPRYKLVLVSIEFLPLPVNVFINIPFLCMINVAFQFVFSYFTILVFVNLIHNYATQYQSIRGFCSITYKVENML